MRLDLKKKSSLSEFNGRFKIQNVNLIQFGPLDLTNFYFPLSSIYIYIYIFFFFSFKDRNFNLIFCFNFMYRDHHYDEEEEFLIKKILYLLVREWLEVEEGLS